MMNAGGEEKKEPTSTTRGGEVMLLHEYLLLLSTSIVHPDRHLGMCDVAANALHRAQNCPRYGDMLGLTEGFTWAGESASRVGNLVGNLIGNIMGDEPSIVLCFHALVSCWMFPRAESRQCGERWGWTCTGDFDIWRATNDAQGC